MKLDLLILAIAPVATIILWIYLKDKYDKEPIRVLSKFFILGILVSTLAIYAEEILIKTNIFTGKINIFYIRNSNCLYFSLFSIFWYSFIPVCAYDSIFPIPLAI